MRRRSKRCVPERRLKPVLGRSTFGGRPAGGRTVSLLMVTPHDDTFLNIVSLGAAWPGRAGTSARFKGDGPAATNGRYRRRTPDPGARPAVVRRPAFDDRSRHGVPASKRASPPLSFDHRPRDGGLLGVESHLVAVRAPEHAADTDASSCCLAEQLADRRPSIRQPLVAVGSLLAARPRGSGFLGPVSPHRSPAGCVEHYETGGAIVKPSVAVPHLPPSPRTVTAESGLSVPAL